MGIRMVRRSSVDRHVHALAAKLTNFATDEGLRQLREQIAQHRETPRHHAPGRFAIAASPDPPTCVVWFWRFTKRRTSSIRSAQILEKRLRRKMR
jgi:hypothetical protein